MFGRKNHGDVKKSAIKVLDARKDNQTRLKHLRVVLDTYDNHEAKTFFDTNYSHIYFVFYEAFTGVENDLKQKANRGHKEDLDYVLFIFEKILTLLPELIHKRWQYHSIGRIMKKLLHTGNSIRLRREGMRLFLIWYQILMDNALEECHQIYEGLVPKLGSSGNADVDIFTKSGIDIGSVAAMEITPVLLPQPGDEQPENLTKWLLELLLSNSVSEVKKIEWGNKEMHEFSFTFLFNKFKEYYLLKIFPNFDKDSSIYEPSLELPSSRTLESTQDTPQRPFEVALCQDVLVKWLAIYAHGSKNDAEPTSHSFDGTLKPEKTDQEEVVMNGAQIDTPTDNRVPGSNASTLSNASGYTEKDSTESSFSSEDQPVSERDIVCQVLYANKENVNMVHEVFRQAFLFPFSHSGAMRKVISVYKEWFHEDSKDHRPPFFIEPSDNISEDSPDGGSPPPPSSQPHLRASEEVKAGMQSVLQVFIINSANVFLLEQSPNPELLEGQEIYYASKELQDIVDMCKRVLNIYRYMVMNITMDQKTWEQLLKVLLKIVSGVLSTTPPKRKENTLGGKLAQPLFQTLIVTWIKANLNVFISAELWDHFLQVLSSLTGWVELVREWAKTMETLTRVLARQVYGLDLNDLPLNRLSEMKEKRRRGAKPMQGSSHHRKQRDRTFSRGWSRHEMVENLRAHLLRTNDPITGTGSSSGPTIQRQTLAVNVSPAVNRHNIHSVSGLPMSPTTDLTDDMSVFRSHSSAMGLRKRSKSGQSSPVRGPKLSDPGPETTNLVRSNSDTSLMVNFETKGSKEMVFEDDDRVSFNDDALGTYYSASEDVDEEDDIRFITQRAAEKEAAAAARENCSQGSSAANGDARSQRSQNSQESPRDRDSMPTQSQGLGSSSRQGFMVRKTSTISTVSLGDTSFNLEDATNIPTSKSTPDFHSEDFVKDIRALRSRFSKEASIDIEDSDLDSPRNIKIDLGHISEVPKVMETDLDDLSSSSQSTLASGSSRSEKSDIPVFSKHLPTILITDNSKVTKSTDVIVQRRSKSRESTPKQSPKVNRIRSADATPIGSPVIGQKLHRIPESFLNRQNLAYTESRPKSSQLDSMDENRNKLIQIKVNEKGNVTKIELRDDGQMTESSTDPTKTENLENPPPSKNDKSKGSQGLRNEDMMMDQSYASSVVADDTSLASLDSSPMIPYQEVSTDSSANCDISSMGERSDTEVLLRINESGSDSRRLLPEESPESNAAQVGSRLAPHRRQQQRDSSSIGTNGSRTRSMEVNDEKSDSAKVNTPRYKDSPTPDRESLHIEETTSAVNTKSSQNGSKSETERQISNEEDLQSVDLRSILAGGNLCGWTPDVAVVLWRRLLGALGDVNKIQDPHIHEQVFEQLRDLVETINKIRSNLSISLDNQSSPPAPELLPPIWLFTPWLVEALALPKDFNAGKLLACQLLCSCVLRRHDLDMDEGLLARFYKVLHNGLVHSPQDMVNVFIRYCNARFFSLPLPGSSMMILDFIHAANSIASSTELKDAPRMEAISLLGALLCFPNHFGTLQVLDHESTELTLKPCSDIKDQLISILLKSGKKEPTGLARCIAISCLGMFLYEEIVYDPEHPHIEETIKVLLSTLRFSNKAVAQVATDMLLLLCDHVPILLAKQPELCEKIIDSSCTAIHCLLAATERSNSLEDKRLLVSIMFCLLEWTMNLPMDMLLHTSPGHKSLLYKIFRVLNLSVTGTHGTLTPRDSQTDMLAHAEDDLEGLREGPPPPPTPTPTSVSAPGTPLDAAFPMNFSGRSTLSRAGRDMGATSSSTSIIKVAARMVMSHLVKHLSHFPMGGGAARMNSSVQECQDLAKYAADEITMSLFDAPTVQFFVVNNTTLMSFVEIPALTNLPGGGVTAGLTTGKTVTRVIMRDVGGRYCWDSSVLYGPPMCRAGSFPAEPVSSLEIVEDMDQVGKPVAEPIELPERDPEELPLYNTCASAKDSLDELLVYIGHTSPECQLYPGECLNVPFHAPVELSPSAESKASQGLVAQRIREADHASTHTLDPELRASAMKPTESCDTGTPFHLCRLFINQFGYLQWGKRPHFDLLKKSDGLRMELKHLDNQICRETHKIAVIYVARGQEDKTTILNNTAGSAPFEEFVSGLGWEIDLEHHPGFMGGLQTNKSTGASAPYYATSTKEVLFHVSTRMPAETEEHKVKKLRHLGNDEVQIIWSEHTRDYRRGIIPTEFGDVLIIIYPLTNGLYRIHIDRKPEVPYFGPLFDGAIVPFQSLMGLVRATAINASQTLRSLRPMYKSFYETRAKILDTLIQKHKETTTFEEFAAKVFAPVLPQGGELIGSHLPEPMLLPNGQTLRGMDNDQTDGSSAAKPVTSSSEKNEKHSPQASSKSKDGDGVTSVFSRRLSFGKGKKSVTKQLQNQREHSSSRTPPGSPNSNYRS